MPTSRWLRRAAVFPVLVALIVVLPARPAFAHVVHSGDQATDFVSILTGLSPSMPGVSAQLFENGQRLAVTNSTLVPLVVLGYHGEPYLRISHDGVDANLASATEAAAAVRPTLPKVAGQPRWHRTGNADTAVWHDPRTHWSPSGTPPVVHAQSHTVTAWFIPARYGNRTLAITGLLRWQPGSSPIPWLVLAAGLAVALVTGAALSPGWPVVLAIGLVGLSAVDLAHQAGNVAARTGTVLARVAGAPAHGATWIVLSLIALATVTAMRRRPVAAVYATGTVAVTAALVDTATNLASLGRSQMLTTLPPTLNRALLAVALGLEIGLVVASVILVRRLEPPRRATGFRS